MTNTAFDGEQHTSLTRSFVCRTTPNVPYVRSSYIRARTLLQAVWTTNWSRLWNLPRNNYYKAKPCTMRERTRLLGTQPMNQPTTHSSRQHVEARPVQMTSVDVWCVVRTDRKWGGAALTHAMAISHTRLTPAHTGSPHLHLGSRTDGQTDGRHMHNAV